ncbi:MAG: DUF3054 domain-containing protein [Oscillochloridaceae bacterium]|nr:DUF3054 domain-containing protein [Chloroflexaceae bacterium]MDW8392241.1 DUF3054 domain-containing protein [Oscillochloridaceae bacterium]
MATHSPEVRALARRTAILVAGDVLALLLFAAIGRRSHGEAAGPGAILEVARTAAPFILGWLIAATLAGAYTPARTRGPGAMALATLIGWTGGLLLGAVFRALMIGRFSPMSFYVITFLVALAILGGWRGVFAVVEQRRAT